MKVLINGSNLKKGGGVQVALSLIEEFSSYSTFDFHLVVSDAVYEQLNIEKAIQWLMRQKLKKETILTEEFIKALHKRMLGEVWSWAGEFRRSEKNIGVPWIRIGMDVKVLLDDTLYWIENNTYAPDEIAIRFKHRLVNIHCFPMISTGIL